MCIEYRYRSARSWIGQSAPIHSTSIPTEKNRV